MRAELTTVRARASVRNAARGWRERVSVRLSLRQGAHVGLGEAAPLPGLSAETLDEAVEALRGVAWPARAPAGPGEVEALTGAIAAPSARFAAETALLALGSHAAGVPLWRWLGEARERVPIAIALWDPERWVEDARRTPGATAYKVKVGEAPLEVEARRLRALRAEIGDAELRLDANRSVPGDALEARARAWASVSPAFVEEPASLDDVAARGALGLRLAFDESLADAPDRALALDVAACVLKPSRLGLFGARALAARAPHARRVVSHLLEGPIARAAAAHLALVLSDDAAGLGPHPALAELGSGLIGRPGAPWIHATHIERPDVPGLGLVG